VSLLNTPPIVGGGQDSRIVSSVSFAGLGNGFEGQVSGWN
jgi:hypothetical protein